MAEEYLELLNEARKKFARGEDASDLIPKITEALAKMSKEAREKALKSPGLTPDEANTELGVLWKEVTLAWIAETAIAAIAASIPFTELGTIATKAFEAPELKWRVDAVLKSLDIKTQARLFAPLIRYFNTQYLPNIIDARTMINLYTRKWWGTDAYHLGMAQWGFAPGDADVFSFANTTRPDFSTLVRMVQRGIIEDKTLQDEAERSGIEGAWVNNWRNSLTPIPGAGDLINFVVKEAFPLADLPAAPAEFVSWMAKQGYSADWCKAYWYAHWRLVPEGTVLDLWHRGFITGEEATKYLVLHDFPIFKRPGQSKTDTEMVLENSYSLLPRIDLRFGWFTGTLTEDEIKALYGKYGFKSEDAVKEITIQKARVLEIYRRGYLSTLQLAYRRGKITEDNFRSKVVAEKFPAEVADWLIKAEDLRIDLGTGVEASNEERALTKSDLIRLYRRGIIDQARLKSELVNLNYSAAEIALLVADADYTAPVEAKEARKLITVSDLENMYKRGLKDRAGLIADLKFRHYEEPDINAFLVIWDAEIAEKAAAEKGTSAKAAEVKLAIMPTSLIEQLYKIGHLSANDVKYFHVTPRSRSDEVQYYLDLWDREKAAIPISPSEALEAFEKGLKNEVWTRAQLTAQNYSTDRINLLVEETKAKIAPVVKPVKLTDYSWTDLEAAYKRRYFGAASIRDVAHREGYLEEVANWRLHLWDAEIAEAKVPKALTKFSLSELQFAWENNLISYDSLISRISAMGYTAEDATIMTRLTTARAMENERNRLLSITESQFKVGLGTEAEVRVLMASIGYIKERQDIIINAWIMERDLGIATDTRDAWLKAYSKGQDRVSVYGYLTTVLKLDPAVVNALLLLEDAKLLKA